MNNSHSSWEASKVHVAGPPFKRLPCCRAKVQLLLNWLRHHNLAQTDRQSHSNCLVLWEHIEIIITSLDNLQQPNSPSMDVSLESDTPQNCESSLFWLISFLLALALAGTFLLICCCLLGGRYYKEQTRNNVENFVQCLKHQAELWKQERERWEAEFKLRLEEQKHKNAAWDQNLELRGDMDDVMEENRVLRDQKDTLNRRNEQLEQENKHVGMENAGLKARLAQVGQLGHEADPESELELEPQPEPEPEPEPERSRNTAGFSSTLFNSGLPPGSNLSLEEAVERDLDSPVSHASFPSTWSDSDPGTTPRPGLPRSPPGNEQDPGTSDEMMTSRDLLSSPKKRNTWAPHSESPSHPPEDDKWKPVTPTKHRSSVG